MVKQLSISLHLPWKQKKQIYFSEILENLYQTTRRQTLKESFFGVHFLRTDCLRSQFVISVEEHIKSMRRKYWWP